MRVVARRLEDFAHEIEIEGGHTVVVDEPPEAGGTGTGPSPTRLIAAGLASCIAVTMEMYAARKGWEIGAVEVDVDVDYDDFIPTYFEATVHLPEDLLDEQRERLLTIARKCPVHKLLASETPVSISGGAEPL